MTRTADFAQEDLPNVSANALADLNHAFRHEISNRPTPRDRTRMERQRSTHRPFIETRGRKRKLDG